MSLPTLSRFLEILRLSGLVDDDELRRFLEQEYGAPEPPESTPPQDVAERLLKADLITSWHAEKLLDGKYKGFRLGNYRLREFLGSGGMSSVYLAEHVHMRQARAVKVLPRKKNDESSRLKRFYLEARASAQLRHPNIVQVYDIDSHDEIHFIVMEYVKGRDLAKLVREDGPLSFDACLSFMIQAAEALQHAHESGLVHRDVKPGNFLVDDNGTLKCMDLGLALFASQDDHSLTQEFNEKVLGTADYLSPEQALSSHHVDSRADIYSLGCTIYYCLAGSPPFPEGTLAQRILNHQTRMPQDPRVFRPDIPQAFVDLIWKMIQKRADDRLQTAAAVADELRRLQAEGWEPAPAVANAVAAGTGTQPRPVARAAGGSSPGSSSDVRNKPPSKIEREALAARKSDATRAAQSPAASTPAVAASGQGGVGALAAIAADHAATAKARRTGKGTAPDAGTRPSDPAPSDPGRKAPPATNGSAAAPRPGQAPAARPAGSSHPGTRAAGPAPQPRAVSSGDSSPGRPSKEPSSPRIAIPAAIAAQGRTPSGVQTAVRPVVVPSGVRTATQPAPASTDASAPASAPRKAGDGKIAGLPIWMVIVGAVGGALLVAVLIAAFAFSSDSTTEGPGVSPRRVAPQRPNRRDTSSLHPPVVRAWV